MTQAFTFITEDATNVDEIKTAKGKVWFTYFNPNGAYEAKKASDARITDAVDKGNAMSGAIIAYGSMNDFYVREMRRLERNKRVSRFDVRMLLEGFARDIADADEFLAGLIICDNN